MKLDANKLTSAVRLALTMGTVVTVGAVGSAYAQSTDNTQKSQSLETIVVTGSNIRRVDIETANPVITIDHAAIQASGKLTLGDLVQQLPSMAGAALNPETNNGGGDGASTISLRGLGSTRSLLLINGHRVATPLQDLNMIPAAAVERIEVLADGASAVYGSDAIGGVVNVITRTNYQGTEIGVDYGISDHDDGERKGVHILFGQSTEKGNIVAGLNYNKNGAVFAANRAFSHDALYKYSTGFVNHAGSSRTPTGAIYLPSDSPLNDTFGCGKLTLRTGHVGTSLSDYRCFGVGEDGNPVQDHYNYQAVGNYDLTNDERTGAFFLGNYKITDSVEVYADVFHNKTVSNLQVAPLPLDTLSDTFISSQSYYNPFGIDFGTTPSGTPTNQYYSRFVSLGDRRTDFKTTHDLLTAGFKGGFGDSSWTWNGDFNYGKLSKDNIQDGFLNYVLLAPGLGPSFNAGTASAPNIVCGTPGNIIAGCTPINIFNVSDPATLAAIAKYATNPATDVTYTTKTLEGSVSGSLFDLPAGAVQLAAGASYRKEFLNATVDSTIVGAVNPQGVLQCQLSGSVCSSPSQGGFNVKEVYGELLVPIIKDQPFIHSLNLDLGDRYSRYSNVGSTNNWKIAVEFRPIEDLLVRGTVSKVFRAPSATDIFAGPVADSPTASDPCGTSNNPACQGYLFQSNGTSQVNGVVTGNNFANKNVGLTTPIAPEFGKSFDYGVVYDPQWIQGLSLNADYYRITLNNLIVSGAGTAQLILNDCFVSNGTAPICSLVKRYTSGGNEGQIATVYESSFNAGNLTTSGFDVGGSYQLPETAWGKFRASVKATYISTYNIDTGFGFTQHYAGEFDKSLGNFARIRGLGTLDWSYGDFTANWTTRYVGSVKVGYADPSLGGSANANIPADYTNSPYHYGGYVLHNVSAGYTIAPINTTIEAGVDNLFDKQPPLFYQQNSLNANVDVSTYDVVGRFYFVKATVKF